MILIYSINYYIISKLDDQMKENLKWLLKNNTIWLSVLGTSK